MSFIGASFPSCSPARSARKAALPSIGKSKVQRTNLTDSTSLTPPLDPDSSRIPVLEPGDQRSDQHPQEQSGGTGEMDHTQPVDPQTGCPKMPNPKLGLSTLDNPNLDRSTLDSAQPVDLQTGCPNLDTPDSQIENPLLLSLFHPSLSFSLSFLKPGIKDLDPLVKREGEGERVCEGERDFLISENSENTLLSQGKTPPHLSKNGQPSGPAVPPITDDIDVPTLIALYQELTGLTPTPLPLGSYPRKCHQQLPLDSHHRALALA